MEEPRSRPEKKNRAFITGASEGIGREFARQLARQGYSVTAVARNTDRLASLLKELRGDGHRVLVADLSTREGVQAAVTELSTGYSLLVNNAGFGSIGDFSEQRIERIREMISLNISALIELTHAFLHGASRGDGIINVSSTLSFLPMPVQAVYSATKAFVTSFSESIWHQNEKKGIHVLNLCPGATRSEFLSRAGGEADQVPDGVLETPEQVVDFALHCYSRKLGPTAVSGWKNRLFVLFSRLVTRRRMARIMGALRA